MQVELSKAEPVATSSFYIPVCFCLFFAKVLLLEADL
jgi:hypothetical protein